MKPEKFASVDLCKDGHWFVKAGRGKEILVYLKKDKLFFL